MVFFITVLFLSIFCVTVLSHFKFFKRNPFQISFCCDIHAAVCCTHYHNKIFLKNKIFASCNNILTARVGFCWISTIYQKLDGIFGEAPVYDYWEWEDNVPLAKTTTVPSRQFKKFFRIGNRLELWPWREVLVPQNRVVSQDSWLCNSCKRIKSWRTEGEDFHTTYHMGSEVQSLDVLVWNTNF